MSDKDVTIWAACHLFSFNFICCRRVWALHLFFFPSPPPIGSTRCEEGVLESCDVSGWGMGWITATATTAVALMAWCGRVNSSSAFNLSMQVLRFLTFTPCGSPLPLSASDSCGVELSNMYCVCVENALLLFRSMCLCVSTVWPCPCVSVCVCLCTSVCTVGSVGDAKPLGPRAGNSIWHEHSEDYLCPDSYCLTDNKNRHHSLLKVNMLKQGGSARPEITLQKTHRGERGEVKVRGDGDREMVGV